MEKPFGQDLWRNLQSIHVERDGTFRAPVRITGDDGIVVGVEAVERVDADGPAPAEHRPGLLSRLVRRRHR